MKRQSFHINNAHIIKPTDTPDFSEIPSALRRRMSTADKISLSLMLSSYKKEVDELVFASEYGEFERLNKIIEQYNEFNEVSPTAFSGSVHNYGAGCFCLLKNLSIPYTALSASKNTLSSGIIKSVISQNNNVLFCFGDYYETGSGVSCIISADKLSEDAIKCELTEGNGYCADNEFEDFAKFLSCETDTFVCPFAKIRRID